MKTNSDTSPGNGTCRILHLRKEFERNLPIFVDVVRGVDNARFSHVICYLGENRGLQNIIAELGYEVLHLGFRKKQLEHFNPAVVLQLADILREKRIDILHCHKHKPTVYGALASILAGRIPVISHVHGLSRTRSLSRRAANWAILRSVHRIIAVSESVRRDVIQTNWQIDPSKVVTVKNCIDLQMIDHIKVGRQDARLRLGLSEDEIVYGTVGRLALTKGQSYLIEAFAQVREYLPASRLVILGQGPLLQALEKTAKDLGVLPWILFAGYRNDVFELLKGFDVFVLPSLAEGLSIALLEAMAMRLPVIASHVGGIPEVFGECRCGKLVQPKDASALAAAMLEIGSAEGNLKKQMGEEGRQRVVEEFTTDVMIRKLTGIYESVLRDNSPSV
jgi:glycosyltransferase involved in cell wall biosynthesis